MKSILFFFLLCVSVSFSQDYTTEELVIPFEWHPESASWELPNENYTNKNFLDARRDFTPELPNSGTGVDLYHSGFHRVDSRFIEFTQYPGNRFFFQEWSDSLRSDLLHFGEVEVDIESLEMEEVMLTSIDGEDSLGFDLFYTFQKVGPWEFRLPDNSKLYGNYEGGMRAGTWTHYLNLRASISFLPVLETFECENGKLKSTESYDKSKLSYDEKMKFMNGKWLFDQLDAKGVALCKQDLCIISLDKVEKSKYPKSNHFHLGRVCATGQKTEELKWSVNQDNTILIDGSTYTILYLTEERLVLQLGR